MITCRAGVCHSFMNEFLHQQTIMSAKSFSKGSAFPALAPGRMRIYSMRFCPYAKRSLLVLAAKNIPHEIVNINLANKPEWLFEKNPFGKVPALEIDDKLLVESLIICDYLDEVYPEPHRLYPVDPYRRAMDRVLILMFDKIADMMVPLNHANVKKSPAAWEGLGQELNFWEKTLKERNTEFFAGCEPGMLDYMIWPWFDRMKPLAEVYSLKPLPCQDAHPTLHRWVDNMHQDAPISNLALPLDMVVKYLRSKLDGVTNYDTGV